MQSSDEEEDGEGDDGFTTGCEMVEDEEENPKRTKPRKGQRRAGYVPKDLQVPALAEQMLAWINPSGSDEAAGLVQHLHAFIAKAKVRGWNPKEKVVVQIPRYQISWNSSGPKLPELREKIQTLGGSSCHRVIPF